MEAYTCPSVRCHPFDPVFIAQSNGDYIAVFSLNPPFKLDKYRRYESHGVSGFPIKCSFSLDSKQIISGSSDGSIYVYDYKSFLQRKLKAYEQACIDVAIHPTLPNVIASCSWNGNISVFQWFYILIVLWLFLPRTMNIKCHILHSQMMMRMIDAMLWMLSSCAI